MRGDEIESYCQSVTTNTMTDGQINHRAYKRGPRLRTQRHDDKTRMLALSVYAETLNVSEAARVTGIPKTTISEWIGTEESEASLDILRSALRHELAFKCAQASALAVETIIDRLQNGDVKVLPSGEQVRVPVAAKDAGYLASTMIDRHALLTGTSANHGKATQALAMVADKLMAAIKLAGQPAGATVAEPSQAAE